MNKYSIPDSAIMIEFYIDRIDREIAEPSWGSDALSRALSRVQHCSNGVGAWECSAWLEYDGDGFDKYADVSIWANVLGALFCFRTLGKRDLWGNEKYMADARSAWRTGVYYHKENYSVWLFPLNGKKATVDDE